MSVVTTEFRAEAGSVLQAQEKILAGYQKVNAELRKQVQEAVKAGGAHQRHGRESKTVFEQMGWTLKGAFIAPLMSMAAPMGVLYLIRTGYQSWLEVVREVAQETRKAAGETVAFLALQEAGDKAPRLQQALRLAEQYGVRDRGQAIDTIQAMQSVWGSFEKGMEAAETIFAASRVGIDVRTGKELEVLGRGKGLAPGEALRMAHIGGELSGLTPKDIATIAPALSFYEDPALAFAIATALSTTTPAGELDTYTKQAGRGLMSTSNLKKWFGEHGVGPGASQFERLRALRAGGIDTAEEFSMLGLNEIRQTKALVDAVTNLPLVEQAYGDIRQKSKPGLFQQELAGIEAEVPMTRFARRADVMETQASNALLERPDLLAADEALRVQGMALRRLGAEAGLVKRTDAEGRMTPAGQWDITIGMALQTPLKSLYEEFKWFREMQQVKREVDATDSKQANELLKQIAENTSPGPGRRPLGTAGKDK